jgi:hypothetical protein
MVKDSKRGSNEYFALKVLHYLPDINIAIGAVA